MNQNPDAADFYIGRNDTARWLGSINDYGHPQDFGFDNLWAIDPDHTRFTPQDFCDRVSAQLTFVKSEGAKTWDEHWPWGYDTSRETAWSYFYDNGTVYVYHYGVEMAQIRCNFYKDQLDEHADGKLRATRPITSAFPSMSGRRG